MNKQDKHTDVLFQKIGSTWFVFTEIDNQLHYSALPNGLNPHDTKIELFHVIEDHLKKVALNERKISPSAL